MSITKEQQQALDDALVPREQRLRIRNYGRNTCRDQEGLIKRLKLYLILGEHSEPLSINVSVEDLVYQIENKVSKKNKDMYYPRFIKVIINHFMLKDQSIPRRNNVDWHMAKYDHILTTIRFIPKHETIQKYGSILPDTLTNQAMKESDAYKTYYDLSTGKVIPRPKLKLYLILGEHSEPLSINVSVEDLVYQIENKVSKKNKDMYYPRFIKVIINHFMLKDQSIPRRNNVDWHMAKYDHILTTIRFIPKHETIQKYGSILPDTLTNQAMKESDAYKTYYDLSTGKVIPRPKYVRRSTKE
nr:hypothetical protein [Tanacetum cinerariifolium]